MSLSADFMSVCLFVCLFVCLLVCQLVCYVYMFVCLYVCQFKVSCSTLDLISVMPLMSFTKIYIACHFLLEQDIQHKYIAN